MTAFFVRLFGIVWVGSMYIDIQYGGPNWGTVVFGIIFLASFIYWRNRKQRDD